MMFYRFTLRVRHDRGYITIRTVAPSEESARRAIMACERCPSSSIRRVYRGARVV